MLSGSHLKPAAMSSRAENDLYIRKDDHEALLCALLPWQRELVARRWLKEKNFFWMDVRMLQNWCWYHHFLATCRQPAGRADGSRGSQ
eukprot:6191922-Pleurochrysis_carterae.AAC.1